MNYVIAVVKAEATDVHLDGIKKVPDKHHLRFGISRFTNFPEDASFQMNSEFPKGLRLTDVLYNVSNLLVVSARMRETLQSIPGALFQNELLPVKIINHKGRTEKAAYTIVHQIDHPLCVDENATVGTKNPVNPDRYQFVEKLVLDETKIDERLMLFRAAQYPSVHLVRRDLAAKLEAENFTGLSFCEIDTYKD